MTTKNILQLLIISVFLISCSQTVNYDEEKEYFEEKKSILYYKGSPYSGVIEKHYKNGELHEKITFKEGKKDGDFESYYENGQLKDKGSYKDGEPHGNYEVYYENGQLREKASYQEGEPHGNYEVYYENGQLEYKASYQEGKKDGNFESYYENGQLEYKETWKGGIKDGDFEEYYDNGQLKSKISFKNGKEIVSKLYAEFKTSKGDFVTELYYHKAPMTVGNFVALAEGNHPEVDEQYQNKKIYNNIIFHRVIDGFMIQAGDPSGTGQGGPGYKFEDEFHPDLKHEKGVLSMANAGPNTNASQFFITLVPTPHLDQKHSVFGQVVEGEQVLKSIEKVETAVMEKPVEDVVIETINIIRKGSEAKSFDAVEAFKQGRVLAAKAKEEAKAEKAKLLEEVSEGFEETESGLRYKITEENPSGKSPETGNTVKVHYTGYLLDGTKFDSSLDRDQPIEFAVGTGRVIPGWDEGIMLLKTGEKAKLVIPSELAYGARQTGPIPPNSVLKFEVELLEVVK